MPSRIDRPGHDGWTRGHMLRAGAAAAALVAGGAAVGARGGGDASQAVASAQTQERVLSLFLLLEQVQEAFYREALEAAELEGDLRTFARTVAEQEGRHVEFLTRRLGARAQDPPRTSFEAAMSSAERFRDTAIELEEAALAAYIGQAGRLKGDVVRAVGTLVSVEARQVAWIRDLAGVSPAPRAADPARKPDDVLADLRRQGFIS